MNYELAKEYINPPKKERVIGAVFCFILSGMLQFIGWPSLISNVSDGYKDLSIKLLIVAAILLASGIVIIIVVTNKNKKLDKKVVSDDAYDRMIDNYLERIKRDHALDVLGVDATEVQEIKPLTFGGYQLTGADYYKVGKDGVFRTNQYETVIIYFSANDIHCYKCSFKTTMPYVLESTDVYFYRDIVSVSTVLETEKLQKTEQQVSKFVLTTTGGTSLTVSLTKRKDTDRSINAMRSLLREKKLNMN